MTMSQPEGGDLSRFTSFPIRSEDPAASAEMAPLTLSDCSSTSSRGEELARCPGRNDEGKLLSKADEGRLDENFMLAFQITARVSNKGVVRKL